MHHSRTQNIWNTKNGAKACSWNSSRNVGAGIWNLRGIDAGESRQRRRVCRACAECLCRVCVWCASSACVCFPGRRGRDALEGKGPQGRPQQRLDRRLEEVAEAVEGGYCRLQMPLKPALGVRETVAGRRLGALEGGGGGTYRKETTTRRNVHTQGGYLPPFQCIPGRRRVPLHDRQSLGCPPIRADRSSLTPVYLRFVVSRDTAPGD